MIKATLNPKVINQLDEVTLTRIAGLCGIGYTSLYRWYKNNDMRITQYAILLAISEVLNIPIDDIITIENK